MYQKPAIIRTLKQVKEKKGADLTVNVRNGWSRCNQLPVD